MCTALRGPAGGSHPVGGRPRLTVALPLYRSARFLALIQDNLDVLAGLPDVEVLVSDRHGLDDALDRLRNRYESEARFRFFAATDGLDWVAHYNWLLAQGRGVYFAWMPHDDTFPPGYYRGLCDHLDAQPDTLLAFGPLIGLDERGRELAWTRPLRKRPSWNGSGSWSSRDAYGMLGHHPWVSFRGVFRRDPILQAGLTLPSTAYNQGADQAWVFGVGLLGPVRFVAVPACKKRFYPESTHRATMPFSVLSMSSMYAAKARYAFRHAPLSRTTVAGLARLARAYLADLILSRVRKLRRAWRGPTHRS